MPKVSLRQTHIPEMKRWLWGLQMWSAFTLSSAVMLSVSDFEMMKSSWSFQSSSVSSSLPEVSRGYWNLSETKHTISVMDAVVFSGSTNTWALCSLPEAPLEHQGCGHQGNLDRKWVICGNWDAASELEVIYSLTIWAASQSDERRMQNRDERGEAYEEDKVWVSGLR